MSSTPPYEHTITGTTPGSLAPTDTALGAIDRQPTTNLTSPLSLVSSNARRFVRPNGQLVHVAGSPDEERRLRKRLTHQNSMSGVLEEKLGAEDASNDSWDIVIHGSPEHIGALKETHERTKTLRDELKIKYGTDWDHLEGVVRELDRLNHELHMLSAHAVNLDANFSKYGYSAMLRTMPGSGEQSESISMHGDHEAHDWTATKSGERMRFYAKPAIRQYFHKGLLWRGSDTTEVATYELFLDLLYVGIIAIAGDGAAEGADGHSLLIFAITFIITWKLWSDVQQFTAWISMDDIVRRLSVVVMLAILLGITVNISGSYDETYVPLVAFYIFGRWYCAVYFVWMGYLMPIVRNAMFGSAFACALPPFIWLGSIWVEEPGRQALIWVALFLDIFGPTILVMFERGVPSIMPKWLLEWCYKTWEFMPGNSIEHKIERTNAFVALVFGYSVVALLYQSTVKFPLNAFYGKAVLGMLQSFAFNWLYFEIDCFNMNTHAIRRSFFSAMVWLSVHLPFVMGFVLSGATLSKLVLAHDVQNSDPEDLVENYAAKSVAEVDVGLIWFYCGGMALALFCMAAIALSHETKRIPGERLNKELRTLYRVIAAIAILLLPLAHEHLTSLGLVATTCGITWSILLVDLAGLTCKGDDFWGFKTGRRCDYSANCRINKRDLEENIKNGDPLDVQELARKNGGRGEENHELIV